MKMWEMIKEMEEGSQDTYQLNYPNGMVVRRKGARVYDITFDSNHTEIDFLFLGGDDASNEWTKLIQPVDFLTAWNNCKENDYRYKNSKIPRIRMFGYRGTVTIVDGRDYGNTITLDGEWVKHD